MKLFLTEHTYVHSAADPLPGNEQHLASLFSTQKKQIKGTQTTIEIYLSSCSEEDKCENNEDIDFTGLRITSEPHIITGSNIISFVYTCSALYISFKFGTTSLINH